MKHPLCKIDNIPSEGMKLIPFIRCEVHVYKANRMPNTTISICTHFEGQLGYKDGNFVWHGQGAESAMEDVQCLNAPAPWDSKLMFLSTRLEDDILYYVWGE